jgi:hypothetical protein
MESMMKTKGNATNPSLYKLIILENIDYNYYYPCRNGVLPESLAELKEENKV